MSSDIFISSTDYVHLEMFAVSYFKFRATALRVKHWAAGHWGILSFYFVSFILTCRSNDV
jgi:hypothetical protein